jgi:tRNA A-37 threonylcarbamoyl transferase component Bud32/tetratricopeptide (TPR) repeat protein
VIGRYVVLGKLGAGAMGVVLSAYDPELDRKIAVKLLEPRGGDRTAARARLQREAQALAKLNHPNVVAVHDVGEHDGQVFLAMEFVHGQTLRDWQSVERPNWREVVEAFAAAGRGLAAAHDVGLIHRDFKPDNVMIGEDGRVRVMDFGLARADAQLDAPSADSSEIDDAVRQDASSAELTRTGAMMGTPAYMAPEQFSAGEVTARADQFAFCVTLYESLFATRPFAGDSLAALAFNVSEGRVRVPPRASAVPSWLRRLVTRGLAPRPDDRFGSMNELLAALGAGEKARKRRRWVGLAGAGAAMVAAPLGFDHLDTVQRTQACTDEGDAIQEIWNENTAAALRESFRSTGAAYAPAVAEKVVYWLDRQAAGWREHATQVCLEVEVHQTRGTANAAKARWCLQERRLELENAMEELRQPDVLVIQDAIQMAASLPPIVTCIDEASLAGLPDPPPDALRPEILGIRKQLSQVRFLERGGSYDDGLELAAQAVTRADALGWEPLAARAREDQALFLNRLGRSEEAEAASIDAYMVAAKSGTWDVAVNAAIHLVFVVGYQQKRTDEAKAWAKHAEVAIALAGDPLGLWEAHRLNNLGATHQAAGEAEQAKAAHRRALEIRETTFGPNHVSVGESLNNLANAHIDASEADESRRLLERSLATLEEALGEHHPTVGQIQANLGVSLGVGKDYAGAREHLEKALAIGEAAFGADHVSLVRTLQNLSATQQSLGDPVAARANLVRAVGILESQATPDPEQIAALHERLAHPALAADAPQ